MPKLLLIPSLVFLVTLLWWKTTLLDLSMSQRFPKPSSSTLMILAGISKAQCPQLRTPMALVSLSKSLSQTFPPAVDHSVCAIRGLSVSQLTDVTVYHLHAAPVPTDGNCTGTLGHVDPFLRGEVSSIPTVPTTNNHAENRARPHPATRRYRKPAKSEISPASMV